MDRNTRRRLWGGFFVAIMLAAAGVGIAQVAFYQRVILTGPCQLSAGSNSPEGVFVGSPCDVYLRTNGGAGTILYLKETGAATNTGWQPVPPGGTIPAASGGTGITSYAVGDLLYASAATTLAKLADVAAGSYLRSGGVTTAPAWSVLKLPDAAAQGEILSATSANTLTALGVGTAGQYLRSAGAAANVAWSTTIWPNAAAQGEIPTVTAANTYTNLAVGTAGQFLRSAGAAANVTWSTSTWPNTIAQGEIPTATGANTITALAVGTAGDYLRSGGGGANVAWRSFVYGDLYLYDNAAALSIDTAGVYHGVTGLASGTVSGFTAGTSLDGVIASVAEGTPADGKVTVTDVGHGLTTGDIVTIHGSTDYDGVYAITWLTADTFEITAAWTVTRTGFWHRPSRLVTGANSAGPARVCFNVSVNAAANGKRYKLEIFVGTAEQNNIAAEYQAGVNTSWQTVSACGIVTLAASDQVWIGIEGITDATDVTVVHGNLNVQRIGG